MSQHGYSVKSIAVTVFIGIGLPSRRSPKACFLGSLQILDDETRGYCLDIPGARERINRDSSLGSRACKYVENNVDQLFEWEAPDRIRATEYDNLCVGVDSLSEGGELFVQDCADTPEQSWAMSADGKLTPQLSAEPLCHIRR